MINEKSAGAVIFRQNKERLYLLLHYEAGHWDFPKGNIEKNETEEETARREIEEETGIRNLRFIKGFREFIHYFYKKDKNLVSKKVVFLLAETKEEHIKLSFEHIGYKWLNYDRAIEQITYNESKKILQKAEKFLNSTLVRFIN